MIMQVSLSRPPLIINSCKRIFTPQLHHVRTISLSKINCKMIENIDALTRQLAPPLTNDKYKGLAGRIGVFGGSLEYTGAPYFAAISALKVGADLSHVFCNREAAPVIKSYSPELIVHPLLDAPDAAAKIEPWLDRLHVIIIGPGLGREPHAFKVVTEVILKCRSRKKPLVIDADGLHYVATHFEMLNEYPAPIVLTPNAAEFQKLTEAEGEGDKQEQAAKYLGLTKSVTFICKGHEDEIFNATSYVKVSGGGSGRRCGGQGDLLSGATAAFLFWATQSLESDEGPVVAAYAACKLARACNGKGFAKYGRSMTCSDMIREIHNVFEELYEPCEK